jgi:hypothetical protein
MPIFLANCTRQSINFSYRVKGINQILWSLVHSGKQVQLDEKRKFTPDQIAQIVEQLENYGAKESSVVSRKMGEFHGILFNTSKPIAESDFKTANAALIRTQEVRSATEAVNSALAFDRGTKDEKTKRRNAKTTSIEIVQDVPYGEKLTGDEVHMNLEVTPQGRDEIHIH